MEAQREFVPVLLRGEFILGLDLLGRVGVEQLLAEREQGFSGRQLRFLRRLGKFCDAVAGKTRAHDRFQFQVRALGPRERGLAEIARAVLRTPICRRDRVALCRDDRGGARAVGETEFSATLGERRVGALVGGGEELREARAVDLRGENRAVETHARIELGLRDLAAREAGAEGGVADKRGVDARGFAQRAGDIARGLGRAFRFAQLADDDLVGGFEVQLAHFADQGGEGVVARLGVGNFNLVHFPTRRAVGVAVEPRDGSIFVPRAGMHVDGGAEGFDKTQVIMRAGKERAGGHEREHFAVGGDARVTEDDREWLVRRSVPAEVRGRRVFFGVNVDGRGRRLVWDDSPDREQLWEICFGPHDGVGEVERGAHGDAIRGERVGRDADDHELMRAERERGRRGREGLAGGAVDEIGDDAHAGRLDAFYGLGDVVEFGLVVADVEDRGRALREGGEHREIDFAVAAARDEVAVFERVAVEQHGERERGVLFFQPVHEGHELRRAFVGGVLVAHEHDHGFRARGGRAQGEDGAAPSAQPTEKTQRVFHDGTMGGRQSEGRTIFGTRWSRN